MSHPVSLKALAHKLAALSPLATPKREQIADLITDARNILGITA